MEKYIYKITNLLDGKIYIGQAKNPYSRFAQHCINYGSRGGQDDKKSLINNAIRKYGKENFNLQIIEGPIKNYNEREQYWINFYNCKTPLGYNITDGGENCLPQIGEENPSATHTKEEINEIKFLLEYTDLSIKEISQLYGYNSHSTVQFINIGKNWHDKERKYPIRQTNCSKNLSLYVVNNIINELLFTNKTQKQIAKEFNVGRHIITAINLGNSYKNNNLKYPLREKTIKHKRKQLNEEDLNEIINLIIENKETLTFIANKYDVTVSTISNIKNGKSYKRDDLIYPLR